MMGYYAAFATGYVVACLTMAVCWYLDQRKHPEPTPRRILTLEDAKDGR